jgi:branched-chain amino acid transport system permease protein
VTPGSLAGRIGWVLLLAAGLAFPFIVGNDYHLTVMSTAYIYALATLGLNLITGYTGQFNLAHAGFMAIGAYTVGILTVDHQVPFWIAFALSGVVTAAVGFFVGIVSLRLKGHYFSIFTLCVGYIMFLLIEKWESLTHGTVGIIGIPSPSAIGPLTFESPRSLYYLVFVFLVLGIWVMRRIVNSLLGRSFVAIRNSDDLAESIGINLMRTKVLAFMLSVFYAGVAGGLYAGFVRFLGPGIAGVEHTFDMTMYMLIGGLGTLLGPLLGAITIPWLTQYLQFLQEFRFVVFGPILVLLVIFLPHGIVGTWLGWQARRASQAEKLAVVAGAPTRSGQSRAPLPARHQATSPTASGPRGE